MFPDLYRLLVFVGGGTKFLLCELLAPHHPPNSVRCARWLTNWSMTAINTAMSVGICATCLYITTQDLWPWRLNTFDSFGSHPWLRVITEVLFLDLVIYWQHRLFPVVPFLWRFHSVHHTDLDLDVSSASRFHFCEILLSSLLKLIVAVLLGVSVIGLAVFEAVMLVATQFQHSNIAVPQFLTRLLWFTLVPPAMHRIHHCPQRRHHDANYGTLLTLWDWIFRTLAHPTSHEPTFGLPEYDRNLSLWSLLALPIARWKKD